jgi:hypothetical protein
VRRPVALLQSSTRGAQRCERLSAAAGARQAARGASHEVACASNGSSWRPPAHAAHTALAALAACLRQRVCVHASEPASPTPLLRSQMPLAAVNGAPHGAVKTVAAACGQRAQQLAPAWPAAGGAAAANNSRAHRGRRASTAHCAAAGMAATARAHDAAACRASRCVTRAACRRGVRGGVHACASCRSNPKTPAKKQTRAPVSACCAL